MTQPPIFPALRGMGYPLTKTPDFSTGNFIGVSGIRLRQIRRLNVLWTFELTYEALDSAEMYPGVGTESWQALAGAMVAGYGSVQNFLLEDDTDFTITANQIGTGDGSNKNFVITRPMGVGISNLTTYQEPVGWVNVADVTQVTVAGSPVGSGWSITAPNILSFTTAPTAGQAIGITVSRFYFQVTFPDDVSFEQIMFNLWDLRSLKLRSLVSNYPSLVLG